MVSDRNSMMLLQNAVLIFIASVITGVIFIIDLHTDSTVAVASVYTIVILYSWLLPGKYASIFTAIICTILTIISIVFSKEMVNNPSDLSQMNMVISFVVIWISVMLVFIAKSSFSRLEGINKQLTESSDILFEKVVKLDLQQEKLSENKKKLENLNADLKIKNRELERFTSITSHDLQEPLRTIGNMTQLISQKYYSHFDDQGKKILDYVNSASDRVTIMIKGLLKFSRIGNKRETQEVNCQELVQNVALDFDVALKAIDGKVKIHELPKVIGNPVELRMLFQNLISNGLKFKKPNESPVVEVSAKEGNDHVEFCVTDNGIGLAEEDYGKIFLIFQRLNPAEEYEGTGLGLAYCRKIVELHGGKIWINSTKGVGSSFHFTLAKKYGN
ncbi:ATP-binding protein [Marivirga salinae]|uniref:histidine kinase n=1 Tax=Marivirga salinarum TaxID=3059078 RepID=A0AA51RE16_9BACT|nr:ATP-binding protein [Marivirga sp. BDSF4-3]WMN11549.1 ATP-binding protein [Marivirga sp. BDSF4-3]